MKTSNTLKALYSPDGQRILGPVSGHVLFAGQQYTRSFLCLRCVQFKIQEHSSTRSLCNQFFNVYVFILTNTSSGKITMLYIYIFKKTCKEHFSIEGIVCTDLSDLEFRPKMTLSEGPSVLFHTYVYRYRSMGLCKGYPYVNSMAWYLIIYVSYIIYLTMIFDQPPISGDISDLTTSLLWGSYDTRLLTK